MNFEGGKIVRESFDELAKRAKSAESLEELFCLWKKAHEAEVEEKTWPETCPFNSENKAQKNFTLDGRLGESPKGGVLFVCKESNLSEDEKKGEKTFWMKETVQQSYTSTCESARAKAARTIYRNRLEAVLGTLRENGYDVPHHLKDCAYMNLNKRGGVSRTRYKILKKYVKKYQLFLIREIELLAPDVIVFCGCYNGVAEHLFSLKEEEKLWNRKPVLAKLKDKPVTLCYVYHPAYPRFKNSLEWIPSIR